MRALWKRIALIHELKHFKIVLRECPLSLIYYPAINIFIQERKYKVMKHFFKGVAVTAGVLIVLMVVQVFCNMYNIHLDSTVTGTTSAVCAMLLYQGLIRIEKSKDIQESNNKKL